MEQIVKKIQFRQSEMIKAHDLAYLNQDEVTKKKINFLKAFSTEQSPSSFRKSDRLNRFANAKRKKTVRSVTMGD